MPSSRALNRPTTSYWHPLHSTPLHSTPLHSIRFDSTRLQGLPARTRIHLVAVERFRCRCCFNSATNLSLSIPTLPPLPSKLQRLGLTTINFFSLSLFSFLLFSPLLFSPFPIPFPFPFGSSSRLSDSLSIRSVSACLLRSLYGPAFTSHFLMVPPFVKVCVKHWSGIDRQEICIQCNIGRR